MDYCSVWVSKIYVLSAQAGEKQRSIKAPSSGYGFIKWSTLVIERSRVSRLENPVELTGHSVYGKDINLSHVVV